MKRILTIALILTGFLFIGCGEEIGMVDPISDSNSPNSSVSVSKEHMFSLPQPKVKLSAEGEIIHSQTETIDGSKGGSVKIKIEYNSNYGNIVEVKSEIKFPEHSFSGERDVTLSLSPDHLSVMFSSNVSLRKKVEYNLEMKGLDLTGLNDYIVSFVSKDKRGNIDYPEYEKLEVKADKGIIKLKNAKLKDLDDFGLLVYSPKWMGMPLGDQIIPEDGLFTQKKSIKGKEGGEIKIQGDYVTPDGRTVKYKSKLKFQKGSFEGVKDITSSVFTKFADVVFEPHVPQFNIPAEYDLEISGLDMSGVDPSKVVFVYQAPNGDIETVEYDKMDVDVDKGTLKIKKALLPHFSRFGFVN